MAESLMARVTKLEPAIKEMWMGTASQETLTDLIREYRAAAEILKWVRQRDGYLDVAEWLDLNGVKR